MACSKCKGTQEIVNYDEEIVKDYFLDEYKKFVGVYLKCVNCGKEEYDCYTEDAML